MTLHELLLPQVILDVVSRIREGQGRLSRWFGFQPDRFDEKNMTLKGPNTLNGDTRFVSWRIDDDTRAVAMGRAPGTGPASVPASPFGNVNVACARFHEKVFLNYEDLSNVSPVIGPNAQIDAGGQDFVARQERKIAKRFNTTIELMTAGLIRGQFYMKVVGENLVPFIADPGGVKLTVDYGIPAGNKSQLNMLGAGNIIGTTWANADAPILDDIFRIKAAFAQLTGMALRHIWVNSILWSYVIKNTQVRNTAGSSNTPFASFEQVPEKGSDGEPLGEYTAILKGDPTIQWHINDEVIATGGTIDPSNANNDGATLEKVIPDNHAIFMPEVSPLWARNYLGGEYVVDYDGAPAVKRSGYYFWTTPKSQPSGIELIGLLNALPLLYRPKAIADGTVVF